MNGQSVVASTLLCGKIARLAAELGCNQEEFARRTALCRQTIQDIFHEKPTRRLRNDTVGRCALALGVTVSDLRDQPLEHLLGRVNRARNARAPLNSSQRYDLATQPALQSWLEERPEHARQLTDQEFDELLSLQGTGGPLCPAGIDHFMRRLERKKRLIGQLHAIAGTEYIDMVEQLFSLICARIQPYRDRA